MKTWMFTLIAGLFILSSCGKNSNVKEPEYRDIRNIRLIELGVLQTTAGIDLVYYNPNNFGVQLTEARGDVYIDDAFLGRFNLGDRVSVGKRSEFIVPAVIKLDMIGAIKNHREIYKKKEAKIRIDGMARVKKAGFSKDVPLRYEAVQNIEKFRGLISQ